jgi:hypothetical protein
MSEQFPRDIDVREERAIVADERGPNRDSMTSKLLLMERSAGRTIQRLVEGVKRPTG